MNKLLLPLCLVYPLEYQGGAEKLGLTKTDDYTFWWRTMFLYSTESPLELVLDEQKMEVSPYLDEFLYREEESRQVSTIRLECGERSLDLKYILVSSNSQYTFNGRMFHLIHREPLQKVDCDELGEWATETYFIGTFDGYYPKDCYKKDATAYFYKAFHGLQGYINCLVKYRIEEIAQVCPAIRNKQISLTITKNEMEVVVFSLEQ